jgi:hypothetical protein
MSYYILRMATKDYRGAEKPAPSPIITAPSLAEAEAAGLRRVGGYRGGNAGVFFKRAEPHPAGR